MAKNGNEKTKYYGRTEVRTQDLLRARTYISPIEDIELFEAAETL
jgi:hypothetical protein